MLVMTQTIGYSCWVPNNSYDIFEIPKVTNSRNYYGEYFYIAHNKSYDYWTIGKMKVSSYRDNAYRYDCVNYDPFGVYDVSTNGYKNAIRKTIVGKSVDLGGTSGRTTHSFDPIGTRKRAYGVKAGNLIAKEMRVGKTAKNIKGEERVPIYKKKNTKKTKR